MNGFNRYRCNIPAPEKSSLFLIANLMIIRLPEGTYVLVWKGKIVVSCVAALVRIAIANTKYYKT